MSELSILPKRSFSCSVFRRTSLGALAAVGLAASALAGGGGPPPPGNPPPNDDCVNAIDLTLDITTAADTNNATFSGLDDCFTKSSMIDVWYKFTAPADGSYRFGTSNAAWHTLALYSACDGSAVACDSSSLAGDKKIDFLMVADQTVYVRIGTDFGLRFELLVKPTPPPPPNDECASASALTLGVSTLESAETVDASSPSNVPPSCGCGMQDLWYTLTAPTDGSYRIFVNQFFTYPGSLCYSNAPAEITAYADCSLTQELACDVVSNGLDEPAAITIALSAGQSALVRIAKCTSAYGPLSWDILADYAVSAPANDSCSQASPLSPASFTVGSTFGATNDAPGNFYFCSPNAAYNVWHSFTNPYNESYVFHFEVTSDNIAEFSPAITVMDDCNGNVIGCAEMSSSYPFASRVTLPLAIGQTVFLSIADSGYCIKPTQGVYTISVDAGVPVPPNDECEDAQPLAPGSSTSGSTRGATVSVQSTSCAFEHPDVWFSITNTEAFPAYYTIDNIGSPMFSMQSFAYYNSCADNPAQCKEEFDLSMNVPVQPGMTALVRIAGVSPERGDFQINVSAPSAYEFPANDLCSGAISLSTFPFQGSIDAAHQMPTPDRSISCNNNTIDPTQAGIWYQFTPSTDGEFVFSVPQWDAYLSCAVFTGSCETLEEIACRSPWDSTPVQLQAGTSYLILVGHFYGYNFADLMTFEFNFTPTILPCPGDFNGNRSVEVADIFAFLNAWFAQFNVCSGFGNCTADINGNETVEVADIFAFLNQWFGQFGRPCP